ncbi:sensory box/GGDEF family protein [Klebsiella pneumoniae]|nr:sensory box/GGDEF family protein [Klebsiella pneumoniae]
MTDVESNPQVRSFVRAIICWAIRSIRRLCRGVETAGQLQILEEEGCDEMQGFCSASRSISNTCPIGADAPTSAGGRKGVTDAQALPARKDAAAPSAARPRTSDRASGRGSARRLRSTLYWQAAVGFDATPQARPRARTVLHGLYRHPRVGTAISRESGRHQDFGLPAKAIAGPDLATGWRNSRSRTAKPSSTRRAQTIRRRSGPDSALVGIYFQVSFRLGNHRFGQQLAKNIIAPVLRGGSAGFPARGSCVFSGGV